jgi:hypothetical protein
MNVVYFFLVFCVADFRLLVVGGLFKLMASVLFTCLLAFVAVHSPNVCKMVTACLRALADPFSPLFVDRRWVPRPQTSIAMPEQQSPSVLFQRPPPLLML